MKEFNIKNISVVGLGKLGSPMAAVIANSGFNVIGLDLNEDVVTKINNQQAPVNEPRLQEFIESASTNISATTSYQEAISHTDVTFIIVPTPSQDDGLFTNDYVISTIKEIAAEIALKSTYHLIIVSSTVIPGSMDGVITSTLEEYSGRKIGSEHLGLCYNPEFIALGSVIENMLRPDITLIGESDKFAGDLLESIHLKISKNKPEIHRLNFINAEITKISINTYVTTKISYANMLAELCDKLPGADVSEVTNAVGGDSRIGRKYLTGAIGYAGPCFPRDNKAFAALGAKVDVNCDIAIATDAINNRQIDRMFNCLQQVLPAGKTIAVLGLSYKIDTAETDESQGLAICKRLAEANYKLNTYDPKAKIFGLPKSVTVYDQAELAVQNAELVLIVTPWPEFTKIPSILSKGCYLIDPWRICFDSYEKYDIIYIPMGMSLLNN